MPWCHNTPPYLLAIDSPILANLEKRALVNLVHASETIEEAKHEISYWFTQEEVVDYIRNDAQVTIASK